MHDLENIEAELIRSIKTSQSPENVLKAEPLKQLFTRLKDLDPSLRGEFGQKINQLKGRLEKAVVSRQAELATVEKPKIDVTAPWDYNTREETILSTSQGTKHPLMSELEKIVGIFNNMGFEAIESKQIDNEKYMFDTLNFPKDHPARDAYDTFRTEEGFIPPAHTSTMQNRILSSRRKSLETTGQIAAISYGRVFRNEDVDATHEHTFYQCEGVYVSKTASLAQLLGVLKEFLETYYGQTLRYRTQPGYFPFTEPSLEFLIERPSAVSTSGKEWLEMLGCGMIHPNVLKMAGIDPTEYRGFAWGGGIDRFVMLKYGIEDLRLFESGKLVFLEKFV